MEDRGVCWLLPIIYAEESHFSWYPKRERTNTYQILDDNQFVEEYINGLVQRN